MLRIRLWFVLVVSLGIVCCNEPTGPAPLPGLHIVSGANVADTVLTLLPRPLVVEVRDANLKPLEGVSVEFTTGPDEGFGAQKTTIRPVGSAAFALTATEATNSRGQAAVDIQLGTSAGPAFVIATAAALSARDSGPLTITPGAPTRFALGPRDTSVLSKGSYELRAQVTDVFGNARPDSVRYGVLTGPASVSSTGLVTGLAIGRAWISVSHLSLEDSAALSVVPVGWLAAYRPVLFAGDSGGLFAFRTDGAQMRVLARRTYPPPSEGWFVWAPSGAQLAYVAGNALSVIDTSGTAHQIVPGDSLPVSNEFPPEYTADGQWVYFTRGFLGSQQTCWRVRPDGTGLAQVSQALTFGIEAHPSPNPANDRFAYLTNRATNSTIDFTLRILHLDSQVIDSLDTPGGYPRWSPVGDRIAYRGNDGLLRTVRPDGTGVRLVGSGAGGAVGFSWSPDGSWIATVGAQGLELLNMDSGEELPLGYGAFFTQPSWLK